MKVTFRTKNRTTITTRILVVIVTGIKFIITVRAF